MVCKNRGMYGFLGTSWVLITYNTCPPGIIVSCNPPAVVAGVWIGAEPVHPTNRSDKKSRNRNRQNREDVFYRQNMGEKRRPDFAWHELGFTHIHRKTTMSLIHAGFGDTSDIGYRLRRKPKFYMSVNTPPIDGPCIVSFFVVATQPFPKWLHSSHRSRSST